MKQDLLHIKTNRKFSKGETHPKVKGIVFHGYRESRKQRWQTVAQYEKSLEYIKALREEKKANAPPKDPSVYTGLNKGCIPQKLLQTGLKDLKIGDPHPTEDGFVLIRIRSSHSNTEQWGTAEQLELKLEKRRKKYDVKAREAGIKSKDYRQTDQSVEFELWDEHPFEKDLFFVGYYYSRAASTKGKKMERWTSEEKLKKRQMKKLEKSKTEKAKRKKSETDRKYRLTHKKKLKLKKSAYHQKVKDTPAYKKQRNQREKTLMENDTHFRIRKLHGGRLRTACRFQGTKKSDTTEKLIGCSIGSLKEHLEHKFVEGMSWENYGRGGWHIDHIIPCIVFDLAKVSHQRVCFNYQNLQPLWEEDNLAKSNNIPIPILIVILKYNYKKITL